MRRLLVLASFAFLVLVTLASPALAQAPAPKVTITGLFDQVTSAGRNFYYANGDFAGLDLYTTFTPNIKNHLAWVDVEDTLAGGDRSANKQIRTDRGKDFAIIESPEFTLFKGLDLKPMFSWFHADGVTTNASRRNATNRRTSGGSMNGAGAYAGIPLAGAAATFGTTAPGDPSMHEERYTVGFD